MDYKTITEVIKLLYSKKMRVVYCPNESLGTNGPFKEVDIEEIMNILEDTTSSNDQYIISELSDKDLLLS